MLYHIAVKRPQEDTMPASRARLATVLRAAKDVVSVDVASQVLRVDRRIASKLLSRWKEQGWLRRIGRGLSVPVPLDLSGSEQVISDPWMLVPALFGNCYVGGWTAAHHWELTEQLFNEVAVFTTRRVVENRVTAQGAVFRLFSTKAKRLFGMRLLWRGTTQVPISDPARTLVDMIAAPQVGGGIDHVADCLKAYLATRNADRGLLIQYAEEFDNGAIFKRLGFLADTRLHDNMLVEECRSRLTQGYAQLDPSLPSKKLVTAWRLWVPPSWKFRAP
jgi:predicted transcriptional regulator of viral defense system